MSPSVAFIAEGRLFLKDGDRPLREIESTFARDAVARHQRAAELDGWKRESVWGSGLGTGIPALEQFQQSAGPAGPVIRFRHVCPGPEPYHLYYVVQIDVVVGVFQYDIANDQETRLLHKDNFPLQTLVRHADHDLYAMSIQQEGGTVRLSTSENRIRPSHHVSGGDSLDQAPCWLHDRTKRLVFQSAPIGRNAEGYHVGVGSYAVELLDLEGEKTETLMEDDETDFLSPRMDADGNLYYIERPWQGHSRQQPSAVSLLEDIVLFPYRLARTFFYFFNFMSTYFSGRPLANSIGLQQSPERHRFMMLWGHALDTQKAINRRTNKADQSIAPADWVLRKRAPDGTVSTISTHVLCFDINAGGDVVYSNGTQVFHLDGEQPSQIASGHMVESLTWLRLPESD